MITYTLSEVYSRMPDITTGTPTYQINNFIHGVHRMPAKWTVPRS
jgi:hypothetical protein